MKKLIKQWSKIRFFQFSTLKYYKLDAEIVKNISLIEFALKRIYLLEKIIHITYPLTILWLLWITDCIWHSSLVSYIKKPALN